MMEAARPKLGRLSFGHFAGLGSGNPGSFGHAPFI
jgi:hypothetical protein